MTFLQDLKTAKIARRVEQAAGRRASNAAGTRETLDPALIAPLAMRVRPKAFAWPGFGVIAEIKRASPSKGTIANHPLPDWVASLQRGGAAMLSVLTEREHFHGSLATLAQAATLTPLPLLRKDFLLAPDELDEAVTCGASAVLLIAAMLDADTLVSMAQGARDRGLQVLVEVHDAPELAPALRALEVCEGVLGINQRDLESLRVDKRHAEKMLNALPKGTPFIVESGIEDAGDLRHARGLGAKGVLVGEALARAPDPGTRLREWLDTLGL